MPRDGRNRLVFAPSKYLDPAAAPRPWHHFHAAPLRDLRDGGEVADSSVRGFPLMRLKDYQRRVLDAVAEYLDLLADWRDKAERAARHEPDITFDWARRAWEKLERRRKPYLARRNGLGEPLPSFCLKVPTGGGKDAAGDPRAGPRELPVPLPPLRTRALGGAEHPDLQPDAPGAAGPRPSLSAAARSRVGRPHPDSRKDRRLQQAGGGRQPVRPAADAAFGEPPDERAAPHVPGRRRLRGLLSARGRPGRPAETARGDTEPRLLRGGRRRRDRAAEDFARERAAPRSAPRDPRRGAQGLQHRGEGDARGLQPVHARRALGHASEGRECPRRNPGGRN